MHQRLRNIENVLCELNEAGFVPIIAHPERYAYIQKNFDNKMLCVSNRNVDLQIYYRAITYISRDKEERKILIHTDTNIFKLNMTLNDIMTLLDERFIQTHRACITNRQRVHEWNWPKSYFVLDNGEKVEYLSKKYKKEVEK